MENGGNVQYCERGHHIYRSPNIGEELDCRREPTNVIDRYAVSVLKCDITIGHLPKKISRVCSLFLRCGGTIICQITGRRRYSSDLPQGGLEVPCLLIFTGKNSDILKLKELI